MAMRAASIWRASSQIGSSACKANSPKAMVLPLCAVPFMRPRCCLRYLVRFGASNMASTPISRPLPPRRVSFPAWRGVTPARDGPRPAAAVARRIRASRGVARETRDLFARFVRVVRLGGRDVWRLGTLALVRGRSGELVCGGGRDHGAAIWQRLALARLDGPTGGGSRLAAWSAGSASRAATHGGTGTATAPLATGALAREITGSGGSRGALAHGAGRPIGRRAPAALTATPRPATISTTEAAAFSATTARPAALSAASRPTTLGALAGIGGRGRLGRTRAFGALALWQDVAMVDPDLDADHAVGGVGLSQAVINVGAQRLQRHTAFNLFLG